MIKKVLSIDLDFILKPIIQLYNDMVKKEPYQLLWSKIEEERCIQDFSCNSSCGSSIHYR